MTVSSFKPLSDESVKKMNKAAKKTRKARKQRGEDESYLDDEGEVGEFGDEDVEDGCEADDSFELADGNGANEHALAKGDIVVTVGEVMGDEFWYDGNNAEDSKAWPAELVNGGVVSADSGYVDVRYLKCVHTSREFTYWQREEWKTTKQVRDQGKKRVKTTELAIERLRGENIIRRPSGFHAPYTLENARRNTSSLISSGEIEDTAAVKGLSGGLWIRMHTLTNFKHFADVNGIFHPDNVIDN
jgi:hypothetical protein